MPIYPVLVPPTWVKTRGLEVGERPGEEQDESQLSPIWLSLGGAEARFLNYVSVEGGCVTLQGETSPCSFGWVDIKSKVAFYYRLQILKRNF